MSPFELPAGLRQSGFDVEPARAARRSGLRLRGRVMFALVVTIVFALTLAALLIRPARLMGVTPEPLAALMGTPVEPNWSEVVRPFQMFDISGGDFAHLPLRYVAKRDAAGSARRDTLTYGAPLGGRGFFRITFYRRGSERVADTSLFVDVARSAAEAGMAVTRSGLPQSAETRFGLFTVSAVTLAGGTATATCLGFRREDDRGPLGISGIACGSVGRPLRPEDLACTLNRLDLVSAGDDAALQGVFVQAERRRDRTPPCKAGHPIAHDSAGLTSTVLKGSMID